MHKKIIVNAVGRIFNRQILTGVLIGASTMFVGYAVSAVDGSGNTLGNAGSELISQQSSVVADSIKADAADCATGTKDGTIGYSIKRALDTHTALASAMPNVESLFDVNNSCFSGLNQIFDLSFSIPSLASIISPAQEAVMKYAQKQVCTASKELSGMVTDPINQAIDKVNGLGSVGDLSGMVDQGLSKLDPNLGSGGYNGGKPGGSYTVGTNPFEGIQTDFGGSVGGGGGNSSSTDMTGTNNQINDLNQKIANLQAEIGPAQYRLQQAQQQLSNCQAIQYNNCAAQQQTVLSAQNALNNLNSQLSSLHAQLASMAPSAYGAQSARAVSVQQQKTSENEGSFIQAIGNLFN